MSDSKRAAESAWTGNRNDVSCIVFGEVWCTTNVDAQHRLDTRHYRHQSVQGKQLLIARLIDAVWS